MKNRLIAVLTVVLLLCSSFSLFAATPIVFEDVKYGDWYYDAVQYVSTNSVMVGISDSRFDPDGAMTRAMVVTVLARLAGAKTDVLVRSSFEDVSFDSWYGLSVEWAKQNGIVKGVSETQFKPLLPVTREQVCLMLSNYFDFLGLSTSNAQKEAFADEQQISPWALDAVIRLQRAGIVNGMENNNFVPRGGCTRAAFAQIVYNSNLASITK